MPTRPLVLTLMLLASLALASDARPPAPPHRATWLTAADVQLRSVTAGEGTPSFLLLHGYGESLVTWQGVLDRLSQGHQVTAVDLPGFGLSDKPAGPYDLDAYLARLGPVLEALPAPRVLVGHSMGGAIAAGLALARPDLVQRLVLIAPAGDSVGLGGLVETVTPAEAEALGVWEAVRAWALPVHAPTWLDDGPRADYDPAADPAYRHAAARVTLEFDFTALRGRFGELALPVLLLWGEWDPVIPPSVGERIVSTLGCGRLVVWPRTFHRPQVAHPAAVADTIAAFVAQERPC